MAATAAAQVLCEAVADEGVPRRQGLRRRRQLRKAATLVAIVAATLELLVGSVAPNTFVGALNPALSGAGAHLARLGATRALAASRGDIEVDGEVTPLGSHMLVKPSEEAAATKSGFLLPESAREKPCEGEVVSVGTGTLHKDTGISLPMWTQVGWRVLYGKYAGDKINIGDVEHVLIRDSDVLLSYSGDEATIEDIKMPRGKVLVELQEKEEISAGGILLSKGAAKSDTTLGKVVVVGDAVLDGQGQPQPLEISVGDKVRFSYGSEVKLELGKTEYRVVDAEDCLAKWRA